MAVLCALELSVNMKKAYRVDRLIMAYPCHPKVFILFNIYKKQYVIFLKCVIHLLIFFSHFHSKMRMYVGVFAFRHSPITKKHCL